MSSQIGLKKRQKEKKRRNYETYGKSLMQQKYQTVGVLKENKFTPTMTELLGKLLMAYNLKGLA